MSTPRRRGKDRQPLNQTVDRAQPLDDPIGILNHENVARRAYQLFEARGGEHGRDWDDWLQAERELRELALHRSIDPARATEGPYAAA